MSVRRELFPTRVSKLWLIPFILLPLPFILYNRMDWKEIYSSNCCIYNQTNRFNDCSAYDECKLYLERWLGSPSIRKECCYDYRPFGTTKIKSYCSYVCLIN